MNKLYQVIIFSLTFVLFSCGTQSTTQTTDESSSNNEIRIGGSSTLFPISKGIIDLYKNDETLIKIEHSGSIKGLDELASGKIDIAGSSRKINDEELKLFQKNSVEVIELEVALDGMTVVVNSGNDWLSDISTADLKKLWEPNSEDKVLKWSDVNAEWPELEFRLFGPGAASGTFDFFTKAIIGEVGSIRSDYLSSENDNELVKGIAAEKNGIGFIGLAYFEQNRDKLKALKINGVEATLQTVQDGTYPPLARKLYLYVSKKSLNRKPVQDFVKHYLDNVSNVALSVGYIPLEDKSLENSQKILNSVIAE